MKEKLKKNKTVVWLYKNIFARGKVGRQNDEKGKAGSGVNSINYLKD